MVIERVSANRVLESRGRPHTRDLLIRPENALSRLRRSGIVIDRAFGGLVPVGALREHWCMDVSGPPQ